MYPRLARLRLRAAAPPKGSAPRNIASAPRPPGCRITMRRGVVALLSIPVSPEDSANGNAARPSARPQSSLRSRLRRSRLFSTQLYNRAFIDLLLLPCRVPDIIAPKPIRSMVQKTDPAQALFPRRTSPNPQSGLSLHPRPQRQVFRSLPHAAACLRSMGRHRLRQQGNQCPRRPPGA